MVLLGEMRHWSQDLVDLHPAVLRHRQEHVEDLGRLDVLRRIEQELVDRGAPAFRSRLSCARGVRISFARWSASMRWTSDRSGAAGCLVAVFVAGGTGGESTYSQGPKQPPRGRKMARPRPELEGNRDRSRRNAAICRDFLRPRRWDECCARPVMPRVARVDLLQRQDRRLAASRAAAIARAAAMPPRERREARDAARDRRAADLPAVGARARAGRRVDDEVDVAALDPVDDVRRALADLVERSTGMPIRADRLARCPRVATIRKPRSWSVWAMRDGARLVGVGDGDEHRAARRQRRAGRGLRLGERGREVARDAHDLAGRAHLRAEHARRRPRSGRTAAPPP